MTQLVTIYVMLFVAVVFAVQGTYWVITQERQSRSAVNRRLLLARSGTNAREVFDLLRRERGLAGWGDTKFGRFNEYIAQTGIRVNQQWLVGLAFVLSIGYFLLFSVAFGFGIESLVLAVVSSISTLVLAAVIIRRKRIARFAQQLPDAIDIIVRGVKAGYPFTVALGLVAREMSDPMGTEIGLVADEIGFGANSGTALDSLHKRVGESELLYLTMAIKVQTETGGNLAEVLTRLSNLIRARAMLALKIRSITAEGRLSALFLSLFPFVIFGLISFLKPDYYSSTSGDPIFFPAVIIGIFLLVVGNIIIYKMVNFRV